MGKPSLIYKIDAYLEEARNSAPTYKKKPAFNPSSLSSPCLRKICYSYKRVEPDFPYDARALRIFGTGDSYETLVNSWLRSIMTVVDYRNKGDGNIPTNPYTGKPDPQFPVEDPELEIRGKLDIVGVIEGKLWVVEIKSINNSAFQTKLQTGPREDHLHQGMIYPFLLEAGIAAGRYSHIPELSKFKVVEGIIFLYINKDTSELKEFTVPKDLDVFAQVMEKLLSVKASVDKGRLPPKTWDFCDGCQFRDKCRRGLLD